MAVADSELRPTPTRDPGLKRRFGDFETFWQAVDYAAKGERGFNFYNGRTQLTCVLTFKELREKALAMTEKLSGLGFEKGDRIAVIADTSPEFAIFFVACQYNGVLPVPLPLPTSFGARDGFVAQLAAQIKSCAASGIMSPQFMTDLIGDAVSDQDLRFCGSFEQIMAHGVTKEFERPGPDDLSYLQYSSGSTRFPHGVSVTQRSLMANTHGMGYHGVRLLEEDRCVSWLPFYHDMGLVGTFLTALACQMTVDFIPTEDFARRPLSWLRVMTKNKCTISYSPTFGFDVCARRLGQKADVLAELDLSTWRVAGIGAEMIRPDVMRSFTEAFEPAGLNANIFLPSYGLAECTLGVSFGKPGAGIEVDFVDESLLTGGNHLLVSGKKEDARMREVVNCGKPLPEYSIEIQDTNGIVLTEGYVGRIFLQGTSVMREYFMDPEATAEVLKDGWLDTGDMGYMKKGCIYIVGRAKDMIIINGKNHWPQDLEWAAEQLDGVKAGDIAAISVPGDNAEEVPLILAQCRLSDGGDRSQLSENLKRQVQRETGVNVLVNLVGPRALPRTSSGKLSRVKARQNYLSGSLQAIAS